MFNWSVPAIDQYLRRAGVQSPDFWRAVHAPLVVSQREHPAIFERVNHLVFGLGVGSTLRPSDVATVLVIKPSDGADKVVRMCLEDAARLALCLVMGIDHECTAMTTLEQVPISLRLAVACSGKRVRRQLAHTDIERLWAPDLYIPRVRDIVATFRSDAKGTPPPMATVAPIRVTLGVMTVFRLLLRDNGIPRHLFAGMWRGFHAMVCRGSSTQRSVSTHQYAYLANDAESIGAQFAGFDAKIRLKALEVRTLLRRLQLGMKWDHKVFGLASYLMADSMRAFDGVDLVWDRVTDSSSPTRHAQLCTWTLLPVEDAESVVLRRAGVDTWSRFRSAIDQIGQVAVDEDTKTCMTGRTTTCPDGDLVAISVPFVSESDWTSLMSSIGCGPTQWACAEVSDSARATPSIIVVVSSYRLGWISTVSYLRTVRLPAIEVVSPGRHVDILPMAYPLTMSIFEALTHADLDPMIGTLASWACPVRPAGVPAPPPMRIVLQQLSLMLVKFRHLAPTRDNYRAVGRLIGVIVSGGANVWTLDTRQSLAALAVSVEETDQSGGVVSPRLRGWARMTVDGRAGKDPFAYGWASVLTATSHTGMSAEEWVRTVPGAPSVPPDATSRVSRVPDWSSRLHQSMFSFRVTSRGGTGTGPWDTEVRSAMSTASAPIDDCDHLFIGAVIELESSVRGVGYGASSGHPYRDMPLARVGTVYHDVNDSMVIQVGEDGVNAVTSQIYQSITRDAINWCDVIGIERVDPDHPPSEAAKGIRAPIAAADAVIPINLMQMDSTPVVDTQWASRKRSPPDMSLVSASAASIKRQRVVPDVFKAPTNPVDVVPVPMCIPRPARRPTPPVVRKSSINLFNGYGGFAS